MDFFNQEHVEIVSRGFLAVRQWKKKNPGLRLNLIGADLREFDLNRTDLSQAWLSGANLSGLNLDGTNFAEAWLMGANLEKADLTRASWFGAKLSRVKIKDAIFDFQSHDLISAVLLAAAGNDWPKRKFAAGVLVSREFYWQEFLSSKDSEGAWARSVLLEFPNSNRISWLKANAND